jgi:hypothetical protein
VTGGAVSGAEEAHEQLIDSLKPSDDVSQLLELLRMARYAPGMTEKVCLHNSLWSRTLCAKWI